MIGVFDSGIGGVTVLKEMIKIMPNENYIYYCDTKNFPYGDKDKKNLIKICDEIVNNLINKGVKLIVIACNTASANCKDYLRNKYSIPIVAIEPAYKMVYDYGGNNKTLVMATSSTIDSVNFINLYNKFDNGNTILVKCSGLADLIEENNKEKILDYLMKKIGKYRNVSNVVLGCTHYPLIKDEIRSVLGDVKFYDGSVGVSTQVKKILKTNNILSNKKCGSIDFIDSTNNLNKKNKFYTILNRGEI